MPFMLSPGVQFTEKDLTNIVPAVSTSAGAFAGVFRWGPVLDPTTVASENELVSIFGSPNDGTARHFFSAANFLGYANNCLVTRADTTGQRNAVVTKTGGVSGISVTNGGSGYWTAPAVTIAAPPTPGGTQAVATANVANGAIVSFTVTTAGTGYTSDPTVTIGQITSGAGASIEIGVDGTGAISGFTILNGGSGYFSYPVLTVVDGGESGVSGVLTVLDVDGTGAITSVEITEPGIDYTAPTVTITPVASGAGQVVTANVVLSGVKINNADDYEVAYSTGAGLVGEFAAKYPGSIGNSLKVSMVDAATYAAWDYKDEFDSVPGTNELHVIVIDEDGMVTGLAGSVLEKYAYASKASNGRKSDGTNVYYKEWINVASKYIWWMDHPVIGTGGTAWGSEDGPGVPSFKVLSAPITSSLSGGEDDYVFNDGDLTDAYALYTDAEKYDISLIITGAGSATVAKFCVESVAEVRKDCVAFCSPQSADNGPIIGVGTDTANTVVAWRQDSSFNVNSSYGVLDSGWKYQYDRYNDVYRWIPLNGDIAGLCARTDWTDDPWFSPGGFTRGQIKNVVKLAFNPNQTARDILYKNGICPVVSFPGQGTLLYGDKTLLSKPSAFDRINVRRLFIVLEKAIATAAKFQLFEFNDQFTRAQFKSMVEPFLRDVKGRRGVIDFMVKCDETNNTGEVIDGNRFVADIFIKPNRSINFINLNFVAVRTSVNFEEIGA